METALSIYGERGRLLGRNSRAWERIQNALELTQQRLIGFTWPSYAVVKLRGGFVRGNFKTEAEGGIRRR